MAKQLKVNETFKQQDGDLSVEITQNPGGG
jgi:hypothetical protein